MEDAMRMLGLGLRVGLVAMALGAVGSHLPGGAVSGRARAATQTWAAHATYEIATPVGDCFHSGVCSGGYLGYTCQNGAEYCCPPRVAGDPPRVTLSQTTVEGSCAESSTEEFPFLGMLWTPGVDPDPPPLSTILYIAPRRSVDPVR
jgi:hypothetical protein